MTFVAWLFKCALWYLQTLFRLTHSLAVHIRPEGAAAVPGAQTTPLAQLPPEMNEDINSLSFNPNQTGRVLWEPTIANWIEII